MNYRNIKINILFYIFLYHLVFESLVNYYDFDEVDKKPFTPLGRILRKYILHQNDIFRTISTMDFFLLFFNLFCSGTLFYIVNKYYGKENVFLTAIKLIGVFIIINIIIVAYTFIDNRMAIWFIYIFYFLFPMSIMTLFIIPLFGINKKISDIFYKEKQVKQ